MRASFFAKWTTRGFSLLGCTVLIAGRALADDATQAGSSAFLQSDWLKPVASGESFKAATGPAVTDPFAVLSTGALWQDTTGGTYTRQVSNKLSLTCDASTVAMGDDSGQVLRSQKVGFQFQPSGAFTFRGDVHDSATEAYVPADSTAASGANFSAETHLPSKSDLTLGVRTERTGIDAPSGIETQTNAYDAQIKQPVGALPLSAILKGHYEDTSEGKAPATSLPSLEQSLQWKPAQDTTIQMGLRQQQYQEYPGVDHALNEALFADWSQRVVDNVSWHSYAEVLNSKGLLDDAPGSPLASGANGTPQATLPGSNASLTSSLPVSIDDQTLTFSTGPSFKVEKDISASLEYSNRWDKNPSPGSIGQEQRISISVKGSF
jgi:hypothetical protein